MNLYEILCLTKYKVAKMTGIDKITGDLAKQVPNTIYNTMRKTVFFSPKEEGK